MKVKAHILPTIIFAQFCCTSLWFAGNAVLPEMMAVYDLPGKTLGWITASVQFGFIIGTLTYALLNIADRFSPSRVFFVSAQFGAILNLGVTYGFTDLTSVLALRFGTGFFLAGIYPVGMKIAADYYEKGLGKSLGYLVGALVLGTAFPHALKVLSAGYHWQSIMAFTSLLAFIGGILLWVLVPNGPHRKPVSKLQLGSAFKIFKNRSFRAAAMGYFGHMWELYTFWAFVPILIKLYNRAHSETYFSVSITSFIVIGVGALGCVIGGYLSKSEGPAAIARKALFASGLCCLLCPVVVIYGPPSIFLGFLTLWGMVVIADSPLFSTLVASNAPTEIKGTALTIVNCLGFAVTVISILVMNALFDIIQSPYLLLILALGPVVGLLAFRRSLFTPKEAT